MEADVANMVDLTIRDWMVIAGALLILAVLLDAWRRVYQDRRAAVRMKLAESSREDSAPADKDIIDVTWFRELPNGGARVVERGAREAGADEQGAASAAASPAAAVESPEPAPRRAAVPRREPRVEEPTEEPAPPEPLADEVELLAGLSSVDEPENLDWLDALESEQRKTRADTSTRVSAKLPRDIQPEVFMLNVVSRAPSGFRGEDIMHILLACDLRFGDMSFFHRHEQEAGRGPIQFSVANMMQPGVFDIDNMSDFNTPGLVFFLTLPGPEDMMKAFDYMLETAQAVARNLGGDVLDETRSVLTRQTLEHARQQIRDLERRLLAKAR
jgi:cell division protein ZipA